jgi:hypothetical protein
MDTLVQCVTCGATKKVDFSTCLRLGWPKCCKVTMRLVSAPSDVGEATLRVLDNQLPPRRERT